MTYEIINDERMIAGSGERNPSAEKGTSMDKNIGDGQTMRPPVGSRVPRDRPGGPRPVAAVKGIQLWEGGPYWADRNIGAESPEDYGYYFWWGDTIGYKRVNEAWVASDGSSEKRFRILWTTVLFWTTARRFSEKNTPTYKKSQSQLRTEGWITASGVLAPEHDAAHVQWGGRWRMPTNRELDDLSSRCDWKWTTVNGVNGYVIRGRYNYDSASIFLPCAGYGGGSSLYYSGSYGNYWSSVPSSGGSYYTRGLGFYSGCRSNGRYYGRSVRPVQGFTK